VTREEYVAIYKASRDSWPRLTAKVMKDVKKAYVTATKQVTDAIARAELRGLSELTTGSLIDIQLQLQKATWAINDAIGEATTDVVQDGLKAQVKADTGFLLSAVGSAEAGAKITASGVSRMVVKLNDRMVVDLVSRMGSGGYALKTAMGYESTIKDLISAGLAQGLDPSQIAKQVTRYVSLGKDGIKEGVWGELKPGARDYYARLPKEIDWRALRIVRTELTASMHSTAIQQARMNPGASGMVDWVRTNDIDWGCNCPANAAGSPYKLDQVPSVDHPNDMCYLRPHTRNFDSFVDDLAKWAGGESVDYLDTWYATQYQG